MLSDDFRTFSDGFRTFADGFRMYSGGFRMFSDGFQTLSDGFVRFRTAFRVSDDFWLSWTAFRYRGRLFVIADGF